MCPEPPFAVWGVDVCFTSIEAHHSFGKQRGESLKCLTHLLVTREGLHKDGYHPVSRCPKDSNAKWRWTPALRIDSRPMRTELTFERLGTSPLPAYLRPKPMAAHQRDAQHRHRHKQRSQRVAEPAAAVRGGHVATQIG